MKFTNEQLVKDAPILQRLSQKELPIKVSYAIAKNISHIESELKIYNNEREKLIDKYAEKDEKGNVKADKDGNIMLNDKAGWDKDIKDLLAIESDIDIRRFKLSQLDGYNLTPGELMAIDYMIEE